MLVSQGMGVAPMLSLLYELEGQSAGKVFLFFQSAPHEPQGILREITRLANTEPGLHVIRKSGDEGGTLEAKFLHRHVPLAHSNIHLAGSRSFIQRLTDELMALDISPAALLIHQVD